MTGQANWLDIARVAAAFAVVLLHTAGKVVFAAAVGGSAWWFGNLYDAAVRWCVPVFVMISGATLLTAATAAAPASRFYAARARRILAPLLFWTAVYLGWQALKAHALGPGGFGLPQAVESLASGRPYYHLWYLYMLPGLYAVAPLLARHVAPLPRRRQGALAGVCLLLAALPPLARLAGAPLAEGPFPVWFLSYLGYFIAGACIAAGPLPSRRTLCVVATVAILATAAGTGLLAPARGIPGGLYFYGYLGATVIPMSLSVFALLRSARCAARIEAGVARLAAASFGIYLVHPIVLEAVSHLLLDPLAVHPAVSVPAVAVAAFSLSFAAAATMRRLPVLRHTV